MPAGKAKKVGSINIEEVNSTKSTNVVEVTAVGPDASIPIEIEADRGANITVVKADTLQNMEWV